MSTSQLLENSKPGLCTTVPDIQSSLQLLAVQRWPNVMVGHSALRVGSMTSVYTYGKSMIVLNNL